MDLRLAARLLRTDPAFADVRARARAELYDAWEATQSATIDGDRVRLAKRLSEARERNLPVTGAARHLEVCDGCTIDSALVAGALPALQRSFFAKAILLEGGPSGGHPDPDGMLASWALAGLDDRLLTALLEAPPLA